MKTDSKTKEKAKEVVEVTRDREARYFTNGVTLSFINWFRSRIKVPNAVVYDLGMQALHEKLSERNFPDLPPIDVGDLDLDALIEKTDSQE